MLVELHLLQNFAPSNLNRDDTGAPKDCELGGHRRARISSQSIKRAIRRESGFAEMMGKHGGVRTRRLVLDLAERIDDTIPASDGTVKLVSDILAEGGIERPSGRGDQQAERDFTKLILHLDGVALKEMAEAIKARIPDLKANKGEVRKALLRELGELLARTAKSPDIALFGRMVEIDGGKPFGALNLGRDASCQVAHAISTNRVSMEMDFYTAVDDLLPSGESGAGMMGTIEFNSACFYRYSNVDLAQLRKNLGGDEQLARQTLRAFLWASILAIPTGKQNSMAAHNPPSLVLAVARESGPWNLANAFVRPVWPGRDGDLVKLSVAALDDYWGKLTTMYGMHGVVGQWLCTTERESLMTLGGAFVENVDALVAQVLEAASFANRERAGRS